MIRSILALASDLRAMMWVNLAAGIVVALIAASFVLLCVLTWVPTIFSDDWTIINDFISLQDRGLSFELLNRSQNDHRIILDRVIFLVDAQFSRLHGLTLAVTWLMSVGSGIMLFLIARRATSGRAVRLLPFALGGALVAFAPQLSDTMVWTWGLPTIILMFCVLAATYFYISFDPEADKRNIVFGALVLFTLASTQTYATGLIFFILLLFFSFLDVRFSLRHRLFLGASLAATLVFYFFSSPPITRYSTGEGSVTKRWADNIWNLYEGPSAFAGAMLYIPLSYNAVAFGACLIAAAAALTIFALVGSRGAERGILFGLIMVAGTIIGSGFALYAGRPEWGSGAIFYAARYHNGSLILFVLISLAIVVLLARNPRGVRPANVVAYGMLAVLIFGALGSLGKVRTDLTERANKLWRGSYALVAGIKDDDALWMLFPFGEKTSSVALLPLYASSFQSLNLAPFGASSGSKFFGSRFGDLSGSRPAPTLSRCRTDVSELQLTPLESLAGYGAPPGTGARVEFQVDDADFAGLTILAVDQNHVVQGIGKVALTRQPLAIDQVLAGIGRNFHRGLGRLDAFAFVRKSGPVDLVVLDRASRPACYLARLP